MERAGGIRWFWRVIVPLLFVAIVGGALIGWPGLWLVGFPLSAVAYTLALVIIWRGVKLDRREGVDTSAWLDRFWRRWSFLVVGLLLGFAVLLIALTILVALGYD